MPVRVAILGCGLIAQREHIPAYVKSEDAQITVFASRDLSKAERLKNEYGANAATDDWKEAILRDDVDVVDICLPNYLHAPAAIAAAEAGKHIIVEKPIARTIAEADAMIEAANKNGVKLMVAHSLRFAPPAEEAQRLVSEGFIGEVNAVRALLNHAGPIEYWGATDTWFFELTKSGGGALLDLGIHVADLVQWVVGAPASSVSAMVVNSGRFGDVEDMGMATIRFSNDVLGFIQASWNYRPKNEANLVVYGDKGTLYAWAYPGKPLVANLRSEDSPDGKLVELEVPQSSRRNNPFDYFVRWVLDKAEPFSTGEEARAALQIITGAYASAKSRCEVELPRF